MFKELGRLAYRIQVAQCLTETNEQTRNIGPLFHEDGAQNPLTVNQERYREILIAPYVQDLKLFCRARNLPVDAARWSYSSHGGGSHLPVCNNTLVTA